MDIHPATSNGDTLEDGTLDKDGDASGHQQATYNNNKNNNNNNTKFETKAKSFEKPSSRLNMNGSNNSDLDSNNDKSPTDRPKSSFFQVYRRLWNLFDQRHKAVASGAFVFALLSGM
jgi:hypothetical protein